ncbi:MAG: dioxygenase [Rhodococcus sp. (in: high G+C Gram-positive bacteria)]
MDIGPEDATRVVVDAFSATPDDRLRQVLISLTEHVHDFVREVDPTMREWEVVIDFLTRTGHKCDDTRQEFMLLSDVFGITNLVETLESQRTNQGATATTVLGPFHMVESPERELGDTIDLIGKGRSCVVEGQVTGIDGQPVAGATIDVWQADDHGFYDVQLPGEMPDGNGRGLFRADDKGQFWFRTVKPAMYPIPTDGPVGELLVATERHPNRPAHIHFIADAPGYNSVTTHAFVAGGAYIESDAVFAVKSSLLVDFRTVDDIELAAQFGVSAPFDHARFDIVLANQEHRG